jgi:asparagine N-glycosylation enzyme membrane subunit Stt3
MFIPRWVLGLFECLHWCWYTAILDTKVQVVPAAVPNISPTIDLGINWSGFVFLEYVSYSIGIAESAWLFRRLTQRRFGELKNTGILIGVVAILLISGALVETFALGILS